MRKMRMPRLRLADEDASVGQLRKFRELSTSAHYPKAFH